MFLVHHERGDGCVAAAARVNVEGHDGQQKVEHDSRDGQRTARAKAALVRVEAPRLRQGVGHEATVSARRYEKNHVSITCWRRQHTPGPQLMRYSKEASPCALRVVSRPAPKRKMAMKMTMAARRKGGGGQRGAVRVISRKRESRRNTSTHAQPHAGNTSTHAQPHAGRQRT